MAASAPLIAAVAFIASLVSTELYRRIAIRKGLLDRPNERSSHTAPTPRGGGLAIVLASEAAFCWLWLTGRLSSPAFAALASGIAVAAIGFIDDRKAVPARLRFLVHAASAAIAMLVLNYGYQLLDVGSAGGIGLVLVLVFGVCWSLNLFNFMDGIDGIAAAEAVFIAVAAAALSALSGGAPGPIDASLAFAAAVAGFLIWNWPPARIFMGDVGSGFLGFIIAVLAVLAAANRLSDFYIWLILSAVFVTDSTVTLITRFIRGQAVTVAHRSHTYQHLALRWRSHRRVTISYLCVNLGWILPLATFATLKPNLGPYLAFICFVPLIALAVFTAAGRPEDVSK